MQRPAAASGPAYLSVREVATRMSVAPRTVKRWISAGILPASRLPSPKGIGHLRIRLSDLEVMVTRGHQS
jgi:excisionase family DNA binding protein